MFYSKKKAGNAIHQANKPTATRGKFAKLLPAAGLALATAFMAIPLLSLGQSKSGENPKESGNAPLYFQADIHSSSQINGDLVPPNGSYIGVQRIQCIELPGSDSAASLPAILYSYVADSLASAFSKAVPPGLVEASQSSFQADSLLVSNLLAAMDSSGLLKSANTPYALLYEAVFPGDSGKKAVISGDCEILSLVAYDAAKKAGIPVRMVFSSKKNGQGHIFLATSFHSLDPFYREFLRSDQMKASYPCQFFATSSTAKILSITCNTIALRCMNEGDYPAAEFHLNKAIRMAKDVSAYYFNLAEVYFQQGKYCEAAEEFKNTLRLSPNFLPAKCGLEKATRKLNAQVDAKK